MINFSTGELGMAKSNISVQPVSKKNSKDVQDASFESIMNLGVSDTNKYEQQDIIEAKDEKSMDDVSYDTDRETVYKKSVGADNKYARLNEEKTDVIEEATDIESGEAVREEFAEKLLAMVDQLAELLGISSEQLLGAAVEKGAAVNDMLDVDFVKSLALDIAGLKQVDVLVNEDVAALMDNVAELVMEYSDELSYQSDFAELLSDFLDAQSETDIIPDVKTDDMNNTVDVLDSTFAEHETADVTDRTVMTASEADEGTFADDMQKSDSDGDSTDLFSPRSNVREDSSIVNNLGQAIEAALDEVDAAVMPINSDNTQLDIVRQLVDGIKANITKEATTLELSLNPASLGKVTITVIEKDGAMQARITAETEHAKNAIEANVAVLKEAFENKELKVDAIEVMVATYEFSEQQMEKNEEDGRDGMSGGIKSLNLDDFDDEDIVEEDSVEIDMMRNAGNKVSYSI